MTVIGQDRVMLWFQPEGPGSEFVPFGVGEKAAGMTGKSVPGAGRSPLYGRTEFGKPVLIKMNTEAPGDLPSATIQLYERGQVDFLLKALNKGCPINVQTRIAKCGTLINPNNWDVIDHWAGGQVTSYNPGDGPSTEYNGEAVTAEGELSFTHYIRLVATTLSRLTTTESQALLVIDGLKDIDCGDCGNGYPGPDQIIYIGAASAADPATANVLYTQNGGGTWAVVSTDPFVTEEDVSSLSIRFISPTQYRVIVGTNAVAAGKAHLAYGDFTLLAGGTTTWNGVTIAATSNGDFIQAMLWATYDKLYIASAGDIYVSEDQGETDPGTAIYTGSTAINGFAISPDEALVYAFGASNLILRETNQNGIFETRVGPSGGAAFTALSLASENTVYAANGTSIYKSEDGANTTGGWTLLKNFGVNKVVEKIQVIGGAKALGGDPSLLRAFVDDTAGGNAEVWLSVDGGANWVQITEVTNLGYNDAYYSIVDDNLAYVVGDVVSSTGLIHRLAEKV